MIAAVYSYSFQHRLQSFRNCSEQAVYNYAIDFAILYLQCLNDHLRTPPHLIEEFGDGYNQKSARFLKRLPPKSFTKCVWLSVGVTEDVGVETKFHEEHPDCEMIGIEVMPKKMDNFRRIGGIGFAGALVRCNCSMETWQYIEFRRRYA
uniref:GRAS domain-containing protein n=1 Tax=Panagrellus redivivus TaxID=6233 RepID=A0A7E4W0R2_PANRE